ncbi:tRNA (N(6)-L-threonylcarbamoyladenosine(37)-C(2))-methylthiotransferase MtaB [Selenomonadales bacterium OttesenSCG-928-I06]|nr:tRNA (N(6)-L-threonylcarbamoyladenosine(37)-C(2))-methylthiotransferase MtaB [Selenomonadales bacterium OttesenSCG-928-I06]
MRKAAFATLGCKVNQYDTETIKGMFQAKGYEIVDFSQIADVYIINTCSVTSLSEKKSRQLMRRASRLNENAIIAVTGCYAQVAKEEIEKIPEIDVITGSSNRKDIINLVEQKFKEKENELSSKNKITSIKEFSSFEDIPILFPPKRTRAFLKIQDGCENYCSYCIIPHTRGKFRSRSLESIIAESKRLIENGFQEIVLTGINLAAYGQDLGKRGSLVNVVKEILQLQNLKRLRLGSLELLEVADSLIDLFNSEDRLCKHLHLPLQSGDDFILKEMNRHYTTSYYREKVNNIRSKVQDISITTDVIVGFPGETEEYFNNTANFIDEMKFAKVHIFPYSKRPKTKAYYLKDQVSEQVKKERVKILEQISENNKEDFEKSFIGKKTKVLFEEEKTVQINGENEKFIEGLTENYLRVFVPFNADYLGDVAKIKVTEHKDQYLFGEILEKQ